MDEILVVDDSIVNQMALKNILKNEYKVVCANSGREMFNILEESDPKLILLDIIMPELNGFEIIEKLKSSSDYSKIPVIFLTGLDDAENEEKGLKLGAIDYITKPFKNNIVQTRVKSYVQLYDFIKKTEDLSQKDGLTGLYNKITTEEIIKKNLLPDSNLKCGTLMIIDIDNFKSINDTFGHLYGDSVITILGKALKAIFQKSDILGRVGGDEFFVFIRNYKDESVIEEKAKEVCDSFRRTFEQNGIKVDVSASIGIENAKAGYSYEEIYTHADAALYNVKARGKNGYAFYTGEEDGRYVSKRTEIENNRKIEKEFNKKIEQLHETMKDYIFNLVEEAKAAEFTIQAILRTIYEEFALSKVHITKLDYTEAGIKCVHAWKTSDKDKKPTVTDISVQDMTEMYLKFKDEDYIVSSSVKPEKIYGLKQDDETDIFIFALKNKTILLGYIAFEREKLGREFNQKMIINAASICHQLSAVIVNQFLIENTTNAKNNVTNILNAIDVPICVVTATSMKPLFLNNAAKNAKIKFHGEQCFKKRKGEDECIDCPLKNAIMNGGFYEDEYYLCKTVEWSNSTQAFMIEYKCYN